MKEKYLEDLKDIKDIMNRSSRFISLSGWSGVVAGIIALAGAYAAYEIVYSNQDYLSYRKAVFTSESITNLILIALATLALTFLTVIFFTRKKAAKNNQKLWDHQSKRLVLNLLIPLATGGLLCLILLSKGYIGLLAPLTLVFYGLALVNASKYTLSEIRSLGLIEVGLGLLATYFIGYGLIFWAVGFGVMHIVYGIFMEVRYRS